MTTSPPDATPPERSTAGVRPRKPLFPNPFYVLLLISSTAFALSALMFYISPFVIERGIVRPGAAPSPGSLALVEWLDRWGPLTLGVEFVVMFLTGCLAMATDHWFSPESARSRANRSQI
jgi:hypothetical protein